MARLPFWLRWSWRDLRQRWVQVIAIALVIAIGTGIYSGLGSMETWRKASNDASFALLNSHDLEISLAEGTVAPQGSLERIIGSADRSGGVAGVGERLVAPTQVAVERPGEQPLLVPGQVVGSSLGPDGPEIDGISADAGRGLREDDAGEPVAVLEASFADTAELPATGRLRLAGGKPFAYVGQGRSPEYFLVTRSGGGEFGGAEAGFAVVFTSLESAQRASGEPGTVNNAVLTLREGVDLELLRAELERGLERAGFAGEVTSQAEEPAYRILYRDAEGDQELLNIFAVLILAGAAFATFNLASRIVESQRREIGIGMALGVPGRELAIRPLLLGLQIALAGALFGTVIGLLAGDLFRGVLEDLLPLPATLTPFELEVFARGAVLGLVLPLVATLVPVWRGVRLQPIEAIRVGFRSAKSSGIAKLGRRLRLPGGSLVQLPLRNALRAPRRTVTTVLGIGAVVTVAIAFLGFIDSFVATTDRSEAEVEQTNPDRITVALDGFHPADSEAVRAAKNAPGVAAAEPRLDLGGELSGPGDSFAAAIGLLDFESEIWHPTVIEGRAPRPGEAGVVIAEEAARDLGVEVGDEIVLTHPQRTGAETFSVAETSLPVLGLHPNPFRNFAYLDRSQAESMGLGGVANTIEITPEPGATVEPVARALFSVPGVASVERADTTTEFVRDRLDDFLGVLRLTVGFALALALLIAFNSTSIAADERARENATMLAFGVPTAEVVTLGVGESLITGLLGTAVGLGGGLLVIGWVVDQTLPNTLPDLGLVVSISPGSLLVAGLVGVVAVALAPLLTARRIRRMDVPSTLRVVE